MEGQYPIKPYVKPKGTSQLTHKTTAKFGKVLELFCDESKPGMVTFYIKSNRGTLKDTIEISLEDALSLANSITGWDKHLPKEE